MTLLALFLVAVAAQSQVRVEFYSESLCPDCKEYCTNQVANAVKNVGSIMNLTLWPYGNAKEAMGPDKQWVFTCQHGPAECLGNMIEACAIKYHNATSDWFPFVNCIEASSQDPGEAAPGCASKSGWTDYATSITTCVKGPEGNALMHSIAVATDSLVPPHQWTPWIVLNGKPLNSGQLSLSLTKLVCDAYQGTKPPGCKQDFSEEFPLKNLSLAQ